MPQVARYQALSYGCKAEVDWREDLSPYYPPTVNNRGMHDFAASVASRHAKPPATMCESRLRLGGSTSVEATQQEAVHAGDIHF